MKTASPLRYPGGKSAMAGVLRQAIRVNRLGGRALAEPFAGGAGASLLLLYGEETPEIYINDADRAIADFWWSVVHRTSEFVDLLNHAPLSISEWKKQRDIYRSRNRQSRVRRGFSAFYLNRCNRSGIVVTGGPIGGIEQKGKWKLDARFKRDELRARCERLSEYSGRVHVSCADGIEIIDALDENSTVFFIDPPYYHKGRTLYMNAIGHEYHMSLAAHLRSMTEAAWVLTYDDCTEIRAMYEEWATIRPFRLRYTASERRTGSEVLIAPRWLELPTSQESKALGW